jgi:hypothetical protein
VQLLGNKYIFIYGSTDGKENVQYQICYEKIFCSKCRRISYNPFRCVFRTWIFMWKSNTTLKMLIHAGLHVSAKTSHHQALRRTFRQNINYICVRIATLLLHLCSTDWMFLLCDVKCKILYCLILTFRNYFYKQLKCRHFSSDTEVIAAAKTWLDGQLSDFFVVECRA